MLSEWIVGISFFVFCIINIIGSMVSIARGEGGVALFILLCAIAAFIGLIDTIERKSVKTTHVLKRKALRDTKGLYANSWLEDGTHAFVILGDDQELTLKTATTDFARVFLSDTENEKCVKIYDGVFDDTEKFWFSKRTKEAHHDYYELFVHPPRQ